jgi:hypothetical protein
MSRHKEMLADTAGKIESAIKSVIEQDPICGVLNAKGVHVWAPFIEREGVIIEMLDDKAGYVAFMRVRIEILLEPDSKHPRSYLRMPIGFRDRGV